MDTRRLANASGESPTRASEITRKRRDESFAMRTLSMASDARSA
jgi:hypothetical protein